MYSNKFMRFFKKFLKRKPKEDLNEKNSSHSTSNNLHKDKKRSIHIHGAGSGKCSRKISGSIKSNQHHGQTTPIFELNKLCTNVCHKSLLNQNNSKKTLSSFHVYLHSIPLSMDGEDGYIRPLVSLLNPNETCSVPPNQTITFIN